MSDPRAQKLISAINQNPDRMRMTFEHIVAAMDECDQVLRNNPEHSTLLAIQGKRKGLQQLVDFVENGVAPQPAQKAKEF